MGGYQGKRGLRADPTRRNNPLVRAAGLAAFAAALPAERPGPGAALADDGTVYLAYCSLVEYGYAVTPAVLAAGQAVALRGERPGEEPLLVVAVPHHSEALRPARLAALLADARGLGFPHGVTLGFVDDQLVNFLPMHPDLHAIEEHPV